MSRSGSANLNNNLENNLNNAQAIATNGWFNVVTISILLVSSVLVIIEIILLARSSKMCNSGEWSESSKSQVKNAHYYIPSVIAGLILCAWVYASSEVSTYGGPPRRFAQNLALGAAFLASWALGSFVFSFSSSACKDGMKSNDKAELRRLGGSLFVFGSFALFLLFVRNRSTVTRRVQEWSERGRLSRAASQVRKLETRLAQRGVPTRVSAGTQRTPPSGRASVSVQTTPRR